MPQIISWKAKRSDILFIWVILLLVTIVFHLTVSLRGERHEPNSMEQILARMQNPMQFLFLFVLILIVFTPLYLIKRKFPKEVIINVDTLILSIQKRSKKQPQQLQIQGLSHQVYSSFIFSVLELYHDYPISSGSKRVRYATLIVPMVGSSFNARSLKEIASKLEALGSLKDSSFPQRSFNDIVSNA